MIAQGGTMADFKKSVRDALMATASTAAAKTMMEDLHGLERGDADVAVEDMAASMSFAAPPEIRPSFATVVSWHRWNDIVNLANQQGNIERMAEAQRQLDAIIRSIH